jgi:hypothetical protein
MHLLCSVARSYVAAFIVGEDFTCIGAYASKERGCRKDVPQPVQCGGNSCGRRVVIVLSCSAHQQACACTASSCCNCRLLMPATVMRMQHGADHVMVCLHAGGRGERLGLGAHGSSASAGLGDVYSSYRQMRSSSYHEMIVRGTGASNMAKGGS